MKAIILAAGEPRRDFPKNGKPKCLYHVRGRVLLDIVTESALEAGVSDVRIVAGYQAEMIRDHIARRGWQVEFVINEEFAQDSVKSLELGLAGVETCALVLCADILINTDLVRGFMKTNPERLAWVRSLVPWDCDRGEIHYDEMYPCDIDCSIIKIPKQYVHIFDGCRDVADRFIARYHWETYTGPGTGVYMGAAITGTFWNYRPIEEVVIEQPIKDIDFVTGTDEFKIGLQVRNLRAKMVQRVHAEVN